MEVKINGSVNDIQDNSSIKDVLTARKLPEDILIIEVNGEIIKREKWESCILRPQDTIEIIRIIGGG